MVEGDDGMSGANARLNQTVFVGEVWMVHFLDFQRVGSRPQIWVFVRLCLSVPLKGWIDLYALLVEHVLVMILLSDQVLRGFEKDVL